MARPRQSTRQTLTPVAAGRAAGWNVIDASTLTSDRIIEADLFLIGTGAGGAVTAKTLTLVGLKVVLVEGGALKSSRNSKMREHDACPALYQESAARKAKSKAINILQGRTVGGFTTVNWTSSFRTPTGTLKYRRKTFYMKNYHATNLAPWFSMMEPRANIGVRTTPSHENNDLLKRSAAQLWIPAAAIMRDVKGCWNLSYCGMGCTTDPKQSMPIATIPSALSKHATLLTRARADRLLLVGDRVNSLRCSAFAATGLHTTGRRITIRARHDVVAGAAINSPALLLRSPVPDPNELLGKRTFLHPTVISVALFAHNMNALDGEPQTICSDHFMDTRTIDGPIGYKLEVPPLHPLQFSMTVHGFGAQHVAMMRQIAHTHARLALLRDGFHRESVDGRVYPAAAGTPVLDYPTTDFLWEGERRALLPIAAIEVADSALNVYPMHENAIGYTTWAYAKQAIAGLPLKPLLTRVVSAHVVGGCTMSDEISRGVVGTDSCYHDVRNFPVHDGSVFPTSVGAGAAGAVMPLD